MLRHIIQLKKITHRMLAGYNISLGLEASKGEVNLGEAEAILTTSDIGASTTFMISPVGTTFLLRWWTATLSHLESLQFER